MLCLRRAKSIPHGRIWRGRVGRLFRRENAGAGKDAAEKDRGIDGRYLGVPHSFSGVDIGEVIEESAVRWQLVPEKRQALENALARLGMTYKAAHFSDTNGGKAEAGGRNTGSSACIFDANIAAIFDQSRGRIRLFPEEEEGGVLKIVEELVILWGKRCGNWRGGGAFMRLG